MKFIVYKSFFVPSNRIAKEIDEKNTFYLNTPILQAPKFEVGF